MSLVPTYVLADNGLLYRDPILRGSDWFLCFDDYDPPELVIACDGRNRTQLESRAREIISDNGIDATCSRISYSGSRVFGKGLKDCHDAVNCWLRIASPMPAALFFGLAGVTKDKIVTGVIETCGGKY